MNDFVFTSNYASFIQFALTDAELEGIGLLLEQSALLQAHAKRYQGKPLVADLSECRLALSSKKLKALWQAFDKRGLNLVGVISPSLSPADLEGTHLSLIYPLGDTAELPLPESLQPLQSALPASVEPVASGSLERKTMVVERPIRAGQTVYAPNSDLVVIGSVNSGAEVVADGNVSIFGELRGRVFAGAKGEESAFVYCQHISPEAELISIAQVFQTSEQWSQSNPQYSYLITLNATTGDLNFQAL
ncbi:MAG: septum site-determining protein MinC [Cardiobacteriaceae bacterium]|nr:septum site-determining protein MinC [Cardiobacteriaceae bacterium]